MGKPTQNEISIDAFEFDTIRKQSFCVPESDMIIIWTLRISISKKPMLLDIEGEKL